MVVLWRLGDLTLNRKANALLANRTGAAVAALSVVGLLSSAVCFVRAQEPTESPSGQSSQQQSDAAAQPAGSQQHASGTDNAGQSQQTEPLKGGVQKVELTLDDIRTINLDVKHLVTASSHLHDEVTMRQISIEQEPEIIGMGTVIMIPVGYQQAGPVLPAKKKRVDLAMSQLRPLIQMFKTDLDEFMSGQKELDLPDDIRQELEPYFKDWISQVNEASEQLAKLEPLVTGPPYDQSTIAGIAADINQDAHNMLKTLKKVYDIVRKEGKKMKRA